MPLQNHQHAARSSVSPGGWAACPHPTPCPANEGAKGVGKRRMPKRGQAAREFSRPTPSVGTWPCPSPQSPSLRTASPAWCFLADLTHYAPMLFLNLLSKQKQALLETRSSPNELQDTHIIHFLTLFSSPSLGGPFLPASSYLSLSHGLPPRGN